MKNFLEKIFLILIAITCINMGTGERVCTTLDPVYTKLEDGAGSYRGTVFNKVDGKLIQTNIIDISFSGKTSIGGIKNENDDSYTTLDFSKITKLIVEDSEYESQRYGRKDFILASVVDNEGKKHSNFLIPKNVIVCGLTEEGRLEKAWFLRYMQKIEILRKQLLKQKPKEEIEEKSILTKITEYVGG